jgi:hypothetical protein
MADHLYCEEQNCQQFASVFGFLGKKKKWRTCEAHTAPLLRKKATLYDITAFNFLRTCEDEPLYRQRRDMMRKGMSNAVMLETVWEQDWKRGKQRLYDARSTVYSVVQQTFEKMLHEGQ